MANERKLHLLKKKKQEKTMHWLYKYALLCLLFVFIYGIIKCLDSSMHDREEK